MANKFFSVCNISLLFVLSENTLCAIQEYLGLHIEFKLLCVFWLSQNCILPSATPPIVHYKFPVQNSWSAPANSLGPTGEFSYYKHPDGRSKYYFWKRPTTIVKYKSTIVKYKVHKSKNAQLSVLRIKTDKRL